MADGPPDDIGGPAFSEVASGNSTKAKPLADVAEPGRAWSKHDVAAQFRLEPVEPREPVVSHVRVGRHPRIVLLHVRTIFCEIPAEGQPSLVVAFVQRIRHRSSVVEGRRRGPWGNRFGFAPNIARDWNSAEAAFSPEKPHS